MANSTIARLADVDVFTPTGEKVRLGEFWASQPVVLVMIRHFGCIFCKQQTAEFLAVLPRIRAAGAELVILGNGQPQHAAWFVEDYQVRTPVVTDPDLVSHRIVGAKKPPFIDPRVVLKGVAAFLKGHRQTKTMGTAGQLGGVFVILPGDELPYSYLSDYAGDHPAPGIVMDALERAVAQSAVRVA